MERKIVRLFVLCLSFMSAAIGFAQEPEEEAPTRSATDSIMAMHDSIVNNLNHQIQELKLQTIMMQEQLEHTGQGAKADSLLKAERKARIDSLRNVTQGAPLVIEGDTLLIIYARKGGMLPEARVTQAKIKINEIGKRLTMFTDSIYVFDSEVSSDVMAGEDVLFSVTDLDALWMGTDRLALAESYRDIISQKVQQLHDTYGLRQKLESLGWVALIIVCQILLIWGIIRFFRHWKFSIILRMMRNTKPLSINNYTLLDTHRIGIAIIFLFNLIRAILIGFVILVGIPLVFTAFPETKTITTTVLGYVWHPLRDILMGVVAYLPNLFKIAVIIVCFRYLLKLIRYFANEIASGRLRINGFYTDWAMPTYTILRFLLYPFMFVMIWPLLPNSDSEIFQGVSVFIGVVVSLGSTSVVGNVVAGIVMTYMRPFHIGDFIRFGDTEGEVIEKSMLVTRIRTRKNDIVTIPNSNMLSSQTSNYTFSAQRYGIIVHTKITIGYDEPHEKIESLLLQAALQTDGIKKHPAPFARVTSLEDFYVEYEINGYTDRAKTLTTVYSALHQQILDTMHGAGVEIMSPHIEARRDNLPVQIPQRSEK